jgi:hypothetical protein
MDRKTSDALSVDDLVHWSNCEIGGLIVRFSPQNFTTITYFLKEFAIETADPLDHLGAFQVGRLLVVGKRRFLDDVKAGLGVNEDGAGHE